MTAPSTAVVLVSRTVLSGGGADEQAEVIAEQLTTDDVVAVVGYIDGADPGLQQALTDVVALGVREIAVIPAISPVPKTVAQWVRRIVGDWYRRRPFSPPVRLAPPVTSVAAYADAVREAVEISTEASDTTAPLLSSAWQRVPDFATHLLMCSGPRCLALGAGEIVAAVGEQSQRLGLTDDDLLVTRTGCLFPCSLGPIAVRYPADEWYGDLTPRDAGSLVSQTPGSDILPGKRLSRGARHDIVQRRPD